MSNFGDLELTKRYFFVSSSNLKISDWLSALMFIRLAVCGLVTFSWGLRLSAWSELSLHFRPTVEDRMPWKSSLF